MTGDLERTRFAVTVAPALILVGNLLDAVFTFTLLQLRVAGEANPFMAWAYDQSPLSFMTLKLGCVQLGLLVLWRLRHIPAAAFAMRVAAGIYAVIVGYHLHVMAVLQG
jgi:hypothetical protein